MQIVRTIFLSACAISAVLLHVPKADACSLPADFDLVWPAEDSLLPVNSSIIVRGSISQVRSASLTTESGTIVAVEYRSVGFEADGQELGLFEPLEPLPPGEALSLTIVAAFEGPGSESEYVLPVQVGTEALPVMDASALSLRATSYFNGSPTSSSICLRATDRSVSTSVDLPSASAPRLVYTESSLGVATLFVPPDEEAPLFVALLPVGAITDSITVSVLPLDGAEPISTPLTVIDFCYGGEFGGTLPEGLSDRWPLRLSDVQQVAQPCTAENIEDTETETAGTEDDSGCSATSTRNPAWLLGYALMMGVLLVKRRIASVRHSIGAR